MNNLPKILASLAIAATALPFTAMSEVLIAPTRVVLEKSERTAELVLVNKGLEKAAFKIKIENRRMLENGSLVQTTEQRQDELFADDFIRYSPRRIVLEPEGRQTIRVSANRSALESGEYRSHLKIEGQPLSDYIALNNPESGGENISITLVAIRSLSIPVIIRAGELDATVEFDSARVEVETGETEEDTTNLLIARLNRSGSKSTFGDIQVFVEDQREPIFYAKGIAIYTPNQTRDVMLPIPDVLRDQITGKPLRIAYVSSDPAQPETYAELRTVLE